MPRSPRQVGAGDSRLREARIAARAALTVLSSGTAPKTHANRASADRLDVRPFIRMLLRLMTLRAAHARALLDAEASTHARALMAGSPPRDLMSAWRLDGLALFDAHANDAAAVDRAMASNGTRACEMIAGEDFAWLETELAPDLLGRVYEDLLGFEMKATASASRRKTGGSYYTPASLVEHLLDLALEPAVASRAKVESVRLLDPSCGGGHFLLGAARRLTKHLMRSNPTLTREEAMTRVMTRCLHGVDLDGDAADVCLVALWLEAASKRVTPGMLRARIRRGHALLGAVPAVEGREAADLSEIPDEAFEAREGDDAATVAALRARNLIEKRERAAARVAASVADAWCAAFVMTKERDASVPTTATLRRLARGESLDAELASRVAACASRHGFFHWELEFPHVWPGDDRGGFDVIVGNPPFLNQLETATVTARREESLMRALSGGSLRGYTDLSATFLLRATQLVATGGRVALVQPQSLLAAKDAKPVRDAVLRTTRLESLWVSNQRVFEGASVFTCAPVLLAGGEERGTVRRTAGADFHDVAPARVTGDALRVSETWAPLAAAAAGVPEVRVAESDTLGELATATADFRDQYYGLEGFLVEEASLEAGADREQFPALITSGLIDVACVRWGRVATRVLKRAWKAPRVDRRRMEQDGELGRWMSQRLVPKVLLATQTRVMEAAADERGELLPCTPVITLTPRDSKDLWLLAAAAASPVASAVALERYSGAAMTADAIKVSAKQVMGLPLPVPGAAWREGAEWFRRATQATGDGERRAALEAFGRVMCGAYGLEIDAAAGVFEWWRGRLDPRKRRAER